MTEIFGDQQPVKPNGERNYAALDASLVSIVAELDDLLGSAHIQKLQKEAHENSPVRKNVITNAEGKVVDIEFIQGNSRGRLKEVFPGEYTIVLSNEQEAKFNAEEGDTLTIPSDEASFPNTQHMAIVHEAGHAVDESIHRIKYQKVKAVMISLAMGLSFVDGRLTQWPESHEDKLPEAFGFIDDKLASYDPAIRDWAKTRLERMVGRVKGFVAKEYLASYYNEQKIRCAQLETKYRVQWERNAWVNAIKGLKEFEQKGIRLVDWSKDEIVHYIESMLSTYATAYKRTTTNKYKFLPYNCRLDRI